MPEARPREVTVAAVLLERLATTVAAVALASEAAEMLAAAVCRN
jgi:hypothetical protein